MFSWITVLYLQEKEIFIFVENCSNSIKLGGI